MKPHKNDRVAWVQLYSSDRIKTRKYIKAQDNTQQVNIGVSRILPSFKCKDRQESNNFQSFILVWIHVNVDCILACFEACRRGTEREERDAEREERDAEREARDAEREERGEERDS